MNYIETLKENREDIIDMLNEALLDRSKVKEAMTAMMQLDARYADLYAAASDNFFGKTYDALKALAEEVSYKINLGYDFARSYTAFGELLDKQLEHQKRAFLS